MEAKNFLSYFDNSDFPTTFGPWISFTEYDPPFKMAELRRMEKQGLIEIDIRKGDKRFRFTQKAAMIKRGE